MEEISAEGLIESILVQKNKDVSKILNADILFLKAEMQQPVDDFVRKAVEHIDDGNDRLAVLVETNGGFIEVVERIVSVFRKHYKVVEFIVPNYAYSAGTVLVMAGDEIYMDYYSILGPIDPQFESKGTYVPGMGYLAKYDELVNSINQPGKSFEQVRAEMSFLNEHFDPGKLYTIEQAIEHSKSLLRDWLPKYKFKDWKTTETQGKPVTQAMKEERANAIAECLGNADKWHSHGRGISIRELTHDDIKLKIKDLGDNIPLNEGVRTYYNLLADYMRKRGWSMAVHTHNGFEVRS